MALNFDPSAYLAAFQYGQNRTDRANQQYAQGMQGVGQGLQDIVQNQQTQRQNRLQNLDLMTRGIQSGFTNVGSWLDYLDKNHLPQMGSDQSGINQPQQPPSSLPQPPNSPPTPPGQQGTMLPSQPGQGQMASAGMSDTGYQMPKPPIQGLPQQQPQTQSQSVSPIVQAHAQQTGFNPLGIPIQGQTGPQGMFANPTLYAKQQEAQIGLQGQQREMAIASQKDDPNSPVSKSMQQIAQKFVPGLNVSNMNATQLEGLSKTLEAYGAKELALEMQKARISMTMGTKESQQQDKLEQQARQAVTNLRGDKSLARSEEQRDAAITAFNRIQEIQGKGGQLNPIDYTDILGQIYKARTGSAPTEQVLSEIRQATAKGNFGKAYTFITGQQAPATTQDITNSLKDMAASMGQQADKFHEGYMKAHLIKPMGLEDQRWQPILNTGRGQSFQEATGYTPNPSGGMQIGRFKVTVQ